MNLRYISMSLVLFLALATVSFFSYKLGQSSALQEFDTAKPAPSTGSNLPNQSSPQSDLSSNSRAIGQTANSLSNDVSPTNSRGEMEGLSASDDESGISVVETEFAEFPINPDTSLVARVASLDYDEALLAAQSEAIDIAWAQEKRGQVSDVVTALLVESSTSPTNLECRSTSCLVEFYGVSELTEQPELLIDFMRMANDIGAKAAVNVDENDLRRGLVVIEWPSD